HRGEILVGTRAIRLQRRLVPARAVLAAAADVGDHVDAAAVEPGTTDAAAVMRQQGNLEAAVAVEQGAVGAVQLEILRGDLEVGHAGAVLRTHEMLADGELRRIEEGGLLLDRLGRGAAEYAALERRRREEAGNIEPVFVAVVGVGIYHADRAQRRRTGQGPGLPAIVGSGHLRWSEHFEAAL